jgi:hypothetical protein
MLNLLKLNRPIIVNGVEYANSQEAYEKLKDFNGEVTIVIPSSKHKKDLLETYNRLTGQDLGSSNKSNEESEEVDNTIWRIKVKQYMTEKSSPGFDFMEKWNNNNPMPLVIMKGRILEETKGMYKMELFAEPEPSTHCFRCGRKLTHPVSVLYGIGPECGQHFHINPFNTEEELQQAMDELKAKMKEIKWTGWVIKSAIKEMRAVTEEEQGYEEGA